MKSLSAAFVALSLAFAAGTASAAPGPLSFGNHSLQDATGFGTAFSDTYSFTLVSSGWLGGQLFTSAALGGIPVIDVQSVLLRRGGNDIGWSQTIAINWDVAENGVEQWALSPTQVAAGQWELIVSGVSYADKAGNGYDADMQLPEPQSLALAALALAGAGLARLRRRAV
ncbi:MULTISPECIES: hypothetical protein [unclassified Roseateles]|jgi:hypothetical protein|uniref:hypothetical protein n=1 Tax=unclassified Roseateles TaxID=2626991 RepID=UPI0006F805E6|nr:MULTISPECIES: hypothetical protein [unclassified Roseateles]KQW42786.1 hypothetical protein ASC81_19185 [Pelomonas sp. Root405]KRA69463.1 hypothetical protein ASD88_19835 [Pelomonas sp. Root662]